MKYNIVINQKIAVELGLTPNQCVILDLLSVAPTWAEPIIIADEVYYWTARQKIAMELPLFKLKKDTIYRHLKKLSENGFIFYKKIDKKDCIKLTELGKKYTLFSLGNESEKVDNSEMNPRKLGNDSEFNSEMNPTYNNTNINNTTNDNIKKKYIKKSTWENLSKERQKKIEEEIKNLKKEEILSFQNYVLALKANGYKYLDFVSAYKNWLKKKEKTAPKKEKELKDIDYTR